MKDNPFPTDKKRRRVDVHFQEVFPPEICNTLLTDDAGHFWLAHAGKEAEALPVTTSEAFSWFLKVQCLSKTSPPLPGALFGRVARAMDAAGIKL